MYKIPLPELKEKIVATGKISAEELDSKIKDKINELSGLISEEGAAHIIANELGVELFQAGQKKLKVKEIYSGMRSVDTVLKVIQKYEVREFSKEDFSGKVCSIFAGDETGTIRVVFWNDQVDLIADLKADDIISIKEAYVRDNRGKKEIHLGSSGSIEINPEGEEVQVVRRDNNFERKEIQSLTGDEDGIEIMGTVVQIFDPRFFYLCPECNKRVMEIEGGFNCNDHGKIEPTLSYVLNLVVDDGTGNIRTVFWKNQTNALLGKTQEELIQFKENPAGFEDLKTDLLGEQVSLVGKVKRNDMFDRLEFSVRFVNKANPQKEVERLETTAESVS